MAVRLRRTRRSSTSPPTLAVRPCDSTLTPSASRGLASSLTSARLLPASTLAISVVLVRLCAARARLTAQPCRMLCGFNMVSIAGQGCFMPCCSASSSALAELTSELRDDSRATNLRRRRAQLAAGRAPEHLPELRLPGPALRRARQGRGLARHEQPSLPAAYVCSVAKLSELGRRHRQHNRGRSAALEPPRHRGAHLASALAPTDRLVRRDDRQRH